MHVFLDASMARKLQLIKLLDAREVYHSVVELAVGLQVSRRTAKTSLEDLVQDFARLGTNAQLIYEDESERSIKLHHNEPFLYDELMSFYLKNEYIFKAFVDILINKNHNFKEFYESEFISMSTAYRKLAEMKKILRNFKLKLDFSEPFPIVGEESQIRYFYLCLFWSVYDGKNWYFIDEKEKMEGLLDEIDRTSGYDVPLDEREISLIWLGIIFARVRRGYLPKGLVGDMTIYNTEQSERMDQLVAVIIKDWRLINVQSERLLLELNNFVSVRNLFSHKVSINFLAQVEDKKIIADVKKVVNQLVAQFNRSLNQEQYNYLFRNVLSFSINHFFLVGDLAAFRVSGTDELKLEPLEDLQPIVREVLASVKAELPSESLLDLSQASISFYTEMLFEMLRLEPGLLKLKVGFFSVKKEAVVRGYKMFINQSWLEPIEFVDQLEEPRDLNISDQYFEFLHEEELPLFILSNPPTLKEKKQLNTIFKKFIYEKFKQIFKSNLLPHS